MSDIDPAASNAPSGQPWAYGVRTCGPDGEAHGGFVWPLEVGAVVHAPDWDPAPRCGGGLHINPWGMGDWSLLSDADDASWLIVRYDPALAVSLDGGEAGGKVKAPWAVIDQASRGPRGMCGVMQRVAALRANRVQALIAQSTETASTGGNSAHAQTTGHASIAAALGESGQARASVGGAIVLAEYVWDATARRYDIVAVFAARVGEHGIEPDVWYRLEGGKPVAVAP